MLPIEMPALEDFARAMAEQGVDVVRLAYPDLTGVERGRDILISNFARTTQEGVPFCRAIYHTSPMGDVVPIHGGIDAGLPDILAAPELESAIEIPWEPGVTHCLANLYNADGSEADEDPRFVLKRVETRFNELGFRSLVGPELEFFLLEEDQQGGWRRYGEASGNVYSTGRRGDPDNLLLGFLRLLDNYGLEVVAANHEFASGQFEINLWHSDAMDAADRAFRFKAALKELARREGMRATFMAKPFNDGGSSGSHLHFSMLGPNGENVFDDPSSPEGISPMAKSAIAGILEHAPALAALCNPTINSYKRFGPDTLAPWLIDWGFDNRSAMVRVPPERGEGARIELRLADASANPYLAIAGLLGAAYLGVRDKGAPGEPLDGYGYDPARSAILPRSLADSLAALQADTELVELLGSSFVDTFVAFKRNELERFSHHVTDWEFREYSYHL